MDTVPEGVDPLEDEYRAQLAKSKQHMSSRLLNKLF